MKVKLQEVLEALEGAGMEEIGEGFIEDFVLLPGQYEINEYRMMECLFMNCRREETKIFWNRQSKGKGHFVDFRIVYMT